MTKEAKARILINDLRRDIDFMNRSLLVSDRISLIRFIPILTRWDTSEVFTKRFSDITASSPNGSRSTEKRKAHET